MDSWLFELSCVVQCGLIFLVSIRPAADRWLVHEGAAATRDVRKLLIEASAVSIGLHYHRVVALTLLPADARAIIVEAGTLLIIVSIRVVPSTSSKRIIASRDARARDHRLLGALELVELWCLFLSRLLPGVVPRRCNRATLGDMLGELVPWWPMV